jgi:hypothetical protein
VRKWLQDNYAALGIEYVLLIGNPDPDNAEPDDLVGDLPMKDCQLHLEADVPTDFYFAELSLGNWDLDGDGLAGEYYSSAGYSLGIPGGVIDKGLFCVRWEGVLEVEFPVAHTNLVADVSAGSTTLDVADSAGFIRWQYVQIGVAGAAETEIARIHAVDVNQLTVYPPLSNTHPAGTPVEMLAFVRLVFVTEGNTKIWFDKDNDGFTDADIVLPTQPEHRPYKEPYYDATLSNGHYPIRVEYIQSGGDAFCKVYLVRWVDVNTAFKHDDGMGTYADGLEADFFNSNDFTGAPISDITSDSKANVQYAAAGDRGLGGVEFYADVIVGRIPCYDEDEDGILEYADLDAILDKTIEYENADIHEEIWRRSILALCPYVARKAATDPETGDIITDPVTGDTVYEYSAHYKWAEKLRNEDAPPPLWDWYRIYEEDYPDVAPPAEVVDGCEPTTKITDAWDDGRGVVMWMSHGSKTTVNCTRHGTIFRKSQCDVLDESKPSIVFMGACNNGMPEFRPPPSDATGGVCLGYENLKKGAVATISASRVSYG